jgi:protein gp37
MSERTSIEWCDHTWSPWEGCQKVGPGCDHCYAEARNQRFAKGVNWGPGAQRRRTADWTKPRLWNRKAAAEGQRLRVFPSLCDPFDNAVPAEWRAEFFGLIAATPHLDWLLLTKRIGNVGNMLPVPFDLERLYPNVWIGATVVNQEEAARDIPKLLALDARVRFLSVEPMLGPVDLTRWLVCCDNGSLPGPGGVGGLTCDRCSGTARGHGCLQLDWVIAGGESGPHARPAHPDWFRSLGDQCAAAGVPFLFKQWGEWAPGDPIPGMSLGEEMRRGTVQLLHAPGNAEGFFRRGDAFVRRIGKKAAGRLLDGVEHNAFPVWRQAPHGAQGVKAEGPAC